MYKQDSPFCCIQKYTSATQNDISSKKRARNRYSNQMNLRNKLGQRPEECESQYVPDSGETYWVVRGYHRLPKKGGKKYALHGGASLEERLVPVLIFSKDIDADVAVTNPPAKKHATELKDEFEGII